jgi:hypothetical protein
VAQPTAWWGTSDLAAARGVKPRSVLADLQRGLAPAPDVPGRPHRWAAGRVDVAAYMATPCQVQEVAAALLERHRTVYAASRACGMSDATFKRAVERGVSRYSARLRLWKASDRAAGHGGQAPDS